MIEVEQYNKAFELGFKTWKESEQTNFNGLKTVSDDAYDAALEVCDIDNMKTIKANIAKELKVLDFLYGNPMTLDAYKTIAKDERVEGIAKHTYDGEPKYDKKLDKVIKPRMVISKTATMNMRVNVIAWIESKYEGDNKQQLLNANTEMETAYSNLLKAKDDGKTTLDELKELETTLKEKTLVWDSLKPSSLNEVIEAANKATSAFVEDYNAQKQLLTKVRSVINNAIAHKEYVEAEAERVKREHVAANLRETFKDFLTCDYKQKVKGIKY